MRIHPFTETLSILLLDEMMREGLTIQTLGRRLGLSQADTAHLVNGPGKCDSRQRVAVQRYFRPIPWEVLSGDKPVIRPEKPPTLWKRICAAIGGKGK